MKKDKKKAKPVNKTPELSKAKKALDDYLKENKLDPQKDWTKDKKHGKKVTELVNKLNKERDKVAAEYPEKDLKNGREMTSDEKKKYRTEQRKLAAGKAPKEEKPKEEKTKKVKKEEKEVPAKKEKKAKDKKKKKAVKEED